jgi:hypothetical protein
LGFSEAAIQIWVLAIDCIRKIKRGLRMKGESVLEELSIESFSSLFFENLWKRILTLLYPELKAGLNCYKVICTEAIDLIRLGTPR